ncbi:MAG TPA: DUF2267 domain-containing protein [Armatimonadota bacterium]
MTKKELLSRLMQVPGITSKDDAESAVTSVFQTLRDRLTEGEADDVLAQLPTEWKEMWESGGWWERVSARMRGLNKLDREEFIIHVQRQIPNNVPAEQVVRVVFHALKEQISPGEADDVSAQLPHDLRDLWKAA